MEPFYFFLVGTIILVFLFVAIITRYRRCPSDKVLVIYGNRGTSKRAKSGQGGGAFLGPILGD